MTEPKLTTTTNDLMEKVRMQGFAPPQPAVFALGNRIDPGRDPLMPKKVAIIGTQPSSRMVAPYNDPEWTIWGTSPGNMNLLPRVDAWVEMHVNLHWDEYKFYGVPYTDWLNKQTFPVLAIDQRFVSRAVTYPLEEIIDEFGVRLKGDPPTGRKRHFFFTSTFAWAMAYAIYVKVETLGVFGVDMSSKDEYMGQRGGGHYFITEAIRRGIDVVIPNESDLAQSAPLYGYSDATPYGRKMATRKVEVKTQMTQLETTIQQAQNQLIFLRGAAENIEYMQAVYGSVDQ